MKLFFDEEWRSRDVGCSFGHDIEASWLIMEAAIEVGDQELVDKVTPVVRKIAEASTEGLQADGSMLYERHSNGAIDADRHWWVQAETVVGMVWLSTHHNDEQALRRAIACFDYIDRNIVDHARGEWFWSRLSQGDVNYEDDKAGEWKCPYHNSRMCFEIMSELKSENN